MESWINDFIKKAEHEINETLSKTIGVETVKEKIAIDNSKLHSSFKLPIEYVDKDSLHPLSSTVRDDLELVNKDEDSVYSKLFQPSNILGHNMIDDWKQQFTSDEQYLTDTQLVLKETKPIPSFFKRYEVDDNEFLDNWNELKIDHSVFLEKYGFIEPLKYFPPGMGISEIVGIDIKKKIYAVSSLNDHGLHIVVLNNENKINSIDRVSVNERIRDLMIYEDKLYLFLEDSGSIGVINIDNLKI